MMSSINEVYELIALAIEKCRETGMDAIAQKLDEVLHLGSSGLEILGAIRDVLNSDRSELERIVDPSRIEDAVNFVGRAFGRV